MRSIAQAAGVGRSTVNRIVQESSSARIRVETAERIAARVALIMAKSEVR